MTVAELKERLNMFDDDMEIYVENDRFFDDGIYKVTSTMSLDGKALLIETNYKTEINEVIKHGY